MSSLQYADVATGLSPAQILFQRDKHAVTLAGAAASGVASTLIMLWVHAPDTPSLTPTSIEVFIWFSTCPEISVYQVLITVNQLEYSYYFINCLIIVVSILLSKITCKAKKNEFGRLRGLHTRCVSSASTLVTIWSWCTCCISYIGLCTAKNHVWNHY